MKKLILPVVPLVVFLSLFVTGCIKEKIVESTEYVHDIKYVESPPDTIHQVDTVYTGGSADTVRIIDTVIVHDSVGTSECAPNALLAIAALHYYSDPLVIDFINQEFGINDGWIFYLSSFQLEVTQQSASAYDLYGFIDYWTPDWASYYPLEFYWQLVHTGGDPADPRNWNLAEPAAAAHQPGIRIVPEEARAERALK